MKGIVLFGCDRQVHVFVSESVFKWKCFSNESVFVSQVVLKWGTRFCFYMVVWEYARHAQLGVCPGSLDTTVIMHACRYNQSDDVQ